ncbi:NUDIX domain-containing protein [Microlunatus sp. Gsoil 973]|uniref:NUDIX hydrolase n=1 Tax=Microlunatus sp. Gsoil 973 TaxID=2672569 RepID=UPI0012B4BE78|nr:NUDIX domain-containing protein [Microlunatus sp. Gsoil 973]QGN32345.1 NUDIX domain-containing protein [Microlunatus sp. Gsoil 973]
MTDFEVTIESTGQQTGSLSWTRLDSGLAPGLRGGPDSLTRAIMAAADDAFERRGLHRLEADVRADDPDARRALLRAGFRLEGRRRQVIIASDGGFTDELIFARLDDDQVDGPDGFSGVMNSALPRKRLIAHVLMRDVTGRVLLCDTVFKSDFELPGGIVEPDESPRLGAIREVKEELGIDIELGRLLAVDWMPHYLGWDDACELIFDGGTVTEEEIAGFVLQPTEIRAVRLIDIADAEPHLTALSFRRLSAITTLDAGGTLTRTLTMEDGRPV